MRDEILLLAEKYEKSGNQEELLAACCLFTLAASIDGGQLSVFQQLCAGFARESLARIQRDKRTGEIPS